MKQYMIYACDGGDTLALVEADTPDEALDLALFEARVRLTQWGLDRVTLLRCLGPFRRSYAMET